MQNKPNLVHRRRISKILKMNVSQIITINYQNFIPLAGQKNKTKTNPIKSSPEKAEALSAPEGAVEWANFKKMNVNFYATGYYESKYNAAEKPPLLKVNSEPFRKGLLRCLIFLSSPTL